MSEAETVQAELLAKFAFLAGAVKVQRAKRVWVEVNRERFAQVFDFLVKRLGFSNLCTITGLDEGADLGFIYHLARDGGLMVNVKTRSPKGRVHPDDHAVLPGRRDLRAGARGSLRREGRGPPGRLALPASRRLAGGRASAVEGLETQGDWLGGERSEA